MRSKPENEFDRFLQKNCDILNQIKPLSHEERALVLAKVNERRNNPLENMTDIQRVIHIAKKNKTCPALATSLHGKAIFNTIEQGKKAHGNRPQRTIFNKPKLQLMDYKEAKQKFWHVYLKDCLMDRDFVIDNNNRVEIDNLLKYFIQDPSGLFDLRKGICLAGGVGTGKTEIMKQLSYFCEDNQLETGFKVQSMREIAKEVARSGIDATTKYLTSNYCFDDIAVGAANQNTFGTIVNPLDDLIQGRYERFTKRNSKPTHFTTNLDFNPNDEHTRGIIENIYDIRSIDRLKQMCNFVYLGGTSRR
jgi:DNA replication protein DnaC